MGGAVAGSGERSVARKGRREVQIGRRELGEVGVVGPAEEGGGQTKRKRGVWEEEAAVVVGGGGGGGMDAQDLAQYSFSKNDVGTIIEIECEHDGMIPVCICVCACVCVRERGDLMFCGDIYLLVLCGLSCGLMISVCV